MSECSSIEFISHLKITPQTPAARKDEYMLYENLLMSDHKKQMICRTNLS